MYYRQAPHPTGFDPGENTNSLNIYIHGQVCVDPCTDVPVGESLFGLHGLY